MEHAIAYPQPHGACHCSPPATVIRHVAFTVTTIFIQCGEATSSGGLERHILRAHQELPYPDMHMFIMLCLHTQDHHCDRPMWSTVSHMWNAVSHMWNTVSHMWNAVSHMCEHRVTYVEHRVTYVERRVTYVEHRVTYVEHRVAYVEHRVTLHKTSVRMCVCMFVCRINSICLIYKV